MNKQSAIPTAPSDRRYAEDAGSVMSKVLVWAGALVFVVGPPSVSIIIFNVEGRSDEGSLMQVAGYAVWMFAAGAFFRQRGAVHKVRRSRRSVPIRLTALGLSVAAALATWWLTSASAWYAVAFASVLWFVAPLPEAMRLGMAPAVSATVSLVAGLEPAMLTSAISLDMASAVAASVGIATVFLLLDRPSLPTERSVDGLEPGDEAAAFPLFERLTVTVGDEAVVNGQSLTVNRGEVVALMGPSGVGKSVLADVAFGLDERLDDVTVSGRVGVAATSGGLVFQAGGGLPHLSVDANLRLVSSNRKRRREFAERFELRPRQPTSTLSGGERRRIAFVRAMLASRGLLWLDEPETGLDLRRVGQLAKMLRERADEDRMAIVVSTHNVGFANAMADRIVYLGNDGRLLDVDCDANAADRIAQLLLASASAVAGPAKRRRAWLRSARHGLRRGWRLVFGSLGLIRESVPFLLHYVWMRAPRSTMVRAFRLAWLRGALYYPFIGAIFGLVFVMAFHIAGDRFVVPAATVIQKFGPEMLLRFAPPIAAILIGSAAGSTIGSWIGTMSAERHLDALEVLGVGTRRWVLGPAWWGLFAAAVLHAVAFAAAILIVFVTYVWHMKGGDFPLQLERFLAGFAESGGLGGAPAKVVGYSVLVASITVGCAGAPLRDSTDVAGAITRSIIWCSVAVMGTELVVAVAGLGS